MNERGQSDDVEMPAPAGQDAMTADPAAGRVIYSMSRGLALSLCAGGKPLFEGADLWFARVNRDRAGQAAGPAMSAMPRWRRLAVKMSPVAMCHCPTWIKTGEPHHA
jgi:hypothetical protein